MDTISIVEACYDLHLPQSQWLERIAQGLQVIGPGSSHGMIAYHLDLSGGGVRITSPVQVDDKGDVLSRITFMAGLLDKRRERSAGPIETLQAALYEKVILFGLRTPSDRLLLSEIDKVGPDWMYTLGVPGVRDHLFLINHHIDGLGATLFVSGHAERVTLRPAARQMYQMLSAHIKAGLRLRRRASAASASVAPPEGGAILDAGARIVDASGDATEAEAREELQAATRAVDRARTDKHGRDEQALEVWRGLVSGRWSLVEQFDRDGKRFMLAHRNPEHVRDPRGLTAMESRVVGLAVRGYSSKLIGYHLGVSEGTASSHLHHALRKLGMANRVELVRTLGTHYPQATDPRFPSA